MRKIFVSILSNIACLVKSEASVDSTKAHFAYLLHPRKHRALVVLPELNADVTRLVNLVHEARVSIDGILDPVEATMNQLISSQDSLDQLSKTESPQEPDVTLVVLGNVGSVKSQDNARCYSLLFAVEKAFGWRVQPVYGTFELEAIRPREDVAADSESSLLSRLILQRFAMIVHVAGPPTQTNGFFGPHRPNVLLHHGDLYKFPSDVLMSRLGSIPQFFEATRDLASLRDGQVCEGALYKLTHALRVGRIITTSQSFPSSRQTWSSRCGTRLVALSSRTSQILVHTFRPLTLTRIGRGQSTRIWPPSHAPGVPKVSNIQLNRFDYLVVIPDIHGDLDGFAKTLWLAFKRVTKSSMSVDKFTHLILSEKPALAARSLRVSSTRIMAVFLGDYVDKGPQSIECIDLLLNVERLLGWSVVALYGNHEYMNLHRLAHHYIHKEDRLIGASRDRAFSIDGSLWKRITNKLVLAARSVGPGGRYLFVHGSLDPSWFKMNHDVLRTFDGSPSNIDDLNTFNRYISEQAPDLTHILREADSPVWSRSLDEMSEDDLCNTHLPALLEMWNVDRVFVGHNPQTLRRVRSRCDGKVLLTDVGISRWMFKDKGNPMAIVEDLRSRASKGTMEAIYFDKTETIA